PVHRSADLAGPSRAVGVPVARLATAARAGRAPSPPTTAAVPGQIRSPAQPRAAGVVRLDDPGDERASRGADTARSGGGVSGALAGGVTIQAVEVARAGGGVERRDAGAAARAAVVPVVGGAGAALAAAGRCVGRSDEKSEQGGGSGAGLRQSPGREPEVRS